MIKEMEREKSSQPQMIKRSPGSKPPPPPPLVTTTSLSPEKNTVYSVLYKNKINVIPQAKESPTISSVVNENKNLQSNKKLNSPVISNEKVLLLTNLN